MIISALTMALLAGCGGSGSAAKTETSSGGDSKYKMAYVLSTRDEYLGQLEECVQKAAADNNVEIESLYAGEDSSKLIDCVSAAKTQGMDAVLINLNAAEDAQACIEAAGDMKVVFINRVPADYSVLGDSAVAVASDEHFSGKYQGEYLAKYFADKGQKEVSYVLLRGTEGLVHTDLRTDGALKALEDAGIKLKEAAVVHANYNRVTARDAFADVLDDGIKFDCIISNNDAMAIGAIAAMTDAGMDPASIPIVGIDATDAGKEEIKNGNMKMSVYQDAGGQASASVQAAINMLDGADIAADTGCEAASDSAYVLYFPWSPVTADDLK